MILSPAIHRPAETAGQGAPKSVTTRSVPCETDSRMFRLFLVHSLRYFARHPALTALNIVGIALGVTVFLSIEIVNHSALESFRASVDIVAGKADLEVIGDGLRFDERAYPIVDNDPDVAAATPTARCAPSRCTTPRSARPTWSISSVTRRSSRYRASWSSACT
jgi:hypothetical protein